MVAVMAETDRAEVRVIEAVPAVKMVIGLCSVGGGTGMAVLVL